MHWDNWKEIANLKEIGGMGFKGLFDHNLALLTRTSW